MDTLENIKIFIKTETKNFFKIKESKRIWHIPLLAALCLGIPIFLGLFLGNLQMGLSAGLGGLVILYYQPSLPLASRMLTMLVCSFGFILSLAVGIGFSFNAYISSIVFGLFAMGIHWVTTYFRTNPPGSFFFIMIASMASCQTFKFDVIPQKIGLIVLGTILACLLALFHGLLTNKKNITTQALSISIKKGEAVPVIESVVIGLFMFISLIIGHLFDMKNPYWIPISCLAVMQGISLYHVWERVVHRIIGTFVGIGLCWPILLFCKTPLSICISIFILQFIIEILIVRHYALAVVFITPMTILLTEAGSSFSNNSEIIISARFMDIALGSFIGAIGGWFIYNQQLKQKVAKQFRKARSFVRKK